MNKKRYLQGWGDCGEDGRDPLKKKKKKGKIGERY